MKTFIALALLFFTVSIFWFRTELVPFDKDTYLNEKVLDMSRPVDVTIDIDLLRSLSPAYEYK